MGLMFSEGFLLKIVDRWRNRAYALTDRYPTHPTIHQPGDCCPCWLDRYSGAETSRPTSQPSSNTEAPGETVLNFNSLVTDKRLYHLEGLGPLLVEAFSLRESLSTPWELHVSTISEKVGLDLDAMLNTEVTLHTTLADGSRWSRKGVVVGAESDEADGGLARYRLEVRPWLYLLAHTRRSQVWQEKSLPTIIDSIFNAYSAALPGVVWTWADDTADHLAQSPFTSADGVRSYTVQYRETDLAFVHRLLAEEGLTYRANPDSSITIVADTTRAKSCPKNPQSEALGSVRFHRDASVENADTVQALGAKRELPVHTLVAMAWDYKAKRSVAVSVPTAFPFAGANAPNLSAYDATSAYAYASSIKADRAVVLMQQTIEARHKTWLGRGTVRNFAAGQQLKITDSPLDLQDADTEFLLTEVIHAGINNLPKDANADIIKTFHEGGAQLLARWVDDAVALQATQSGYGNSFEAIRSKVPWRPRLIDDTGVRLNARPTAPGPLIATVVGPNGQTQASGADEIHCDALGRVKIQYDFQRTDQMGGDTSKSSTWVRVMQPITGPGMGFQFLPRIGHEVLIDFFDTDFDRPYVLASLYNGKGEGGIAATPGGKDGKSDKSVFAKSTDHSPGAQGNLAGGNSPAWHGASGEELDAQGQRNSAALSGIKSKEFGGDGFNQLVFDDSNSQTRVQLATTQHATQLNMGHLIHQADNHRGSFRGLGFELRTDAYGAFRAKQGVLITTNLTQSSEPAGDNAAGMALIGQWAKLTSTFSGAASSHKTVAYADEIGSFKDNQSALFDQEPPAKALVTAVKGMVAGSQRTDDFSDAMGDVGERNTSTSKKLPHSVDPIVAVVAQAGLATTAGQDIQVAAGDTIHIGSGQDTNQAVGGAFRLHTGQAIGMLGGATKPGGEAAGTGITFIAGKGDIDYQAQAGLINISAKRDVKVQSQTAHIDWAAAKKIVLSVSGGASITIEGGNITFELPGKLTVNAGKKSFVGPARENYPLPTLPRQVCLSCLLSAQASGSPFAAK
jgi:type VI secretion system secreted protein VgrG